MPSLSQPLAAYHPAACPLAIGPWLSYGGRTDACRALVEINPWPFGGGGGEAMRRLHCEMLVSFSATGAASPQTAQPGPSRLPVAQSLAAWPLATRLGRSSSVCTEYGCADRGSLEAARPRRCPPGSHCLRGGEGWNDDNDWLAGTVDGNPHTHK